MTDREAVALLHRKFYDVCCPGITDKQREEMFLKVDALLRKEWLGPFEKKQR